MTLKRKKQLIGVIVVVCLLLVAAFALYIHSNSVVTVIGIDVNPSIEISVNSREVVQDVDALNKDGEDILDDMDFDGVDLKVAINAIVGSMVKHGYIDEVKNTIIVSTWGKNNAKSYDIQAEVREEIDEILAGLHVTGAVIGQTIETGAQGDINAKASEYGISPGKAALIEKIVSHDVSKSFDSLADASVSELALLTEEKGVSEVDRAGGATNRDAYLMEDDVKNIAYTDAGVAAADVKHVRVHLDYDDGFLVYEVEFIAGGTEYEYEIDATSGNVIKRDVDRSSLTVTPPEATLPNINPPTSTEAAQQNTNSDVIGEERAKEIVLEHSGLTASEVEFVKVRLEYDDWQRHYEITFLTSDTEYEYDVDATSGRITDFDFEKRGYDDDYDFYRYETEHHDYDVNYNDYDNNQNNGHTHHNDGQTQGSGTSAYIGDDAARQIALSDAGVTDPQRLSSELDNEDGIMVYNVEFKAGGMEYDYEIDASSGKILKRDSERDD